MEFIENFLQDSDATNFFEELKQLDFYRPKLTVCETEIYAQRKVFAVGHPETTYAFSGELIYARPWTSATAHIKRRVQEITNSKYNFVLLSLYEGEDSRLSYHQLNATCLDTQSNIVTVCLGDAHTMQIRKNGVTREHRLNHGTLVNMDFRENLICNSNILEEPGASCFLTLTYMNVTRGQPVYKKPKIDWFDLKYASMQTVDTLFTSLCGVFLKELNQTFWVDLRRVEHRGNNYYPTKEGLMMTPHDFFVLSEKIEHYTYSNQSNGIANHILIMDLEDRLHLQKVNVNEKQLLTLDYRFIKLFYSEVSELQDKLEIIRKHILVTLWENFLPTTYYKYFDEDHLMTCDEFTANSAFLAIVEHFITPFVQLYFPCYECSCNSNDLSKHTCENTSMRHKYETLGPNILTLINIEEIVKMCAKLQLFSIEFMQSITVDFLDSMLFKE